jgi:8-oxo-dGTP pyrophosphatase MutT (NUDIX family)
MHKTHKNFLNLLKTYLSSDKPGEWAQKLMMPEGRILTPNHTKNPTPSAILLVLFESNTKIYFPLIRRSIYDGLHSGQMAFPGGKYEETDSDLIATALRETEEEIGIDPKLLNILGTLSPLYIPITNMEILPVVAYVNTKPQFVLNNLEVDELFEVNISDFLSSETKKKENWNLRDNWVDVPYYYLQEQKVWGATAMILSEFEQIVKHCMTQVTK